MSRRAARGSARAQDFAPVAPVEPLAPGSPAPRRRRRILLAFGAGAAVVALVAAGVLASLFVGLGSSPASPNPTHGPPSATPGDDISAMVRIDEQHGWAWDQSLYRLMVTSDGGASWWDATPPEAACSVSFVDAAHGWCLGGFTTPRLFRTTDGGASWQEAQVPSGRSGLGGAVRFVSVSVGYLLLPSTPGSAALSSPAAGGSEPWTLYRSRDGGTSWERVSAPIGADVDPASRPGVALVFSTERDGFLFERDLVLQTHDGGVGWSPLALPGSVGTRAIELMGVLGIGTFGSDVVLQADIQETPSPGGHYAVFVSGDGGRSWEMRYDSGPVVSTGLWAFVSATTWLHFEGNRVSATNDEGRTWTARTATLPAGRQLMAVSFASSSDGWAIEIPTSNSRCVSTAGCPLPPTGGPLAQTHDGGLTWTLIGAAGES